MNESEHVGPIIFSHPVARRQLVEHGRVVTFRTSERTTGETWWRESRTGPKKGDVTVRHVREVGPVSEPTLHEYADESGFPSVAAWVEAIGELNGGRPAEGHLYRAVVR